MNIIRFKRNIIAITLAFTLPASISVASERFEQPLELESATVYFRGAELTNRAPIDLPKGESRVVFTDVANDIDQETLMIRADQEVIVKSFSIERDYLQEAPKESNDALQDEWDRLTFKKKQLDVKAKVIETQMDALKKNIQLGTDENRATVNDLEQLWKFIDQSMTLALEEKLLISEAQAELREEIDRIEKQLGNNHEVVKRPVTNIVVDFIADQPIKGNVDLTYTVNRAGWAPSYDLRTAKFGEPIEITYKADLSQNSGIDWKGATLKLSTGDLRKQTRALTLVPQRISIGSDAIKGLSASSYEANYGSLRMSYDSVSEHIPEQAPSFKAGGVEQYVTTDAGGLNLTYNIALPYVIPSDGKSHQITIKSETVKGDYAYVSTPKLKEEVYLQAELNDWEALNLLPGIANIFFEGRYVGKTDIELANIYDQNLPIQLGPDNRISISRESSDFHQSKPTFFGDQITQKYGYSINVKNMRNNPITLKVFDQVPVSTDETLKVTDIRYDKKAVLDDEKGELKWELTIDPNQSLKLPFGFSIKYPKDSMIFGL